MNKGLSHSNAAAGLISIAALISRHIWRMRNTSSQR
jgi:hypothetical protein